MKNGKKLLTMPQAASLLEVKVETVKKYIQEGKIKPVKGNGHRIDKKSIKEFIANVDEENEGKGALFIMRKFLLHHADTIQKSATREHKIYLGGGKFKSEYLDKYQRYHIKVIEELSNNLLYQDLKRGTTVFNKLAENLATDSVKDGLTLEEAVDGIIFLKQAVWKEMKKRGMLEFLTAEDFYQVSLTIGTYCDIIASKIAFVYHDKFVKELEKQKKKVEEAVAVRDQFISAASHELKTPVTSLKVYTQGLEKQIKKGQKETTVKYFKKIDGQVDKLATLIEDLLNVTRLQHGKLEFTMTGFDIQEVLQESVEAIRGTDEKHEFILVGKVGKKVFGDKYRIYQVITNLLTNAIKYSPNADKIVIWTVPKNDRVVVSVEDFGIGISPAQQAKIFQQFYRVTQHEAETFPGMGMGLYIASELIKRHGSTLTVKSKKGKGSTFSFSLPYVEI